MAKQTIRANTRLLHQAIKEKDLEMVKTIISLCPTPAETIILLNNRLHGSRDGNSLCIAVRHWHNNCMCQKANNYNCGIFTVHPHSNDIIRLLLENGANPLIRDDWGKNALDRATANDLFFSSPAFDSLDVFADFGYHPSSQ